MSIEALIKILVEYGPIGVAIALIILAVLVGVILKRMDSNSKADGERAKEFREALSQQQAETEKRFCEQSDRMAAIEKDYVTREAHYKDIGGWRAEIAQLRSDTATEIRGVRDAISGLTSNLITIVAEGAKKNGN